MEGNRGGPAGEREDRQEGDRVMARVLIVDDDELICEMLSLMVEDMGHSPSFALTLKTGYEKAALETFDVVFLDIRMPDGNGLDLLPRIRELPSHPEVIIITGLGDPDGAELAIKNGAWDYIEKSSSTKEMSLPFVRALQYREEKNARKPLAALKLNGIIGNSIKMKMCLDLLAQAAHSEASVLLTGETGTGKEVFARAIHDNSIREKESFVVVDCTALPETLVESVLFGHERGAFTGADKAQDGLVKQAHGGSLFLDEVGEPPAGHAEGLPAGPPGASLPSGGCETGDGKRFPSCGRDEQGSGEDGARGGFSLRPPLPAPHAHHRTAAPICKKRGHQRARNVPYGEGLRTLSDRDEGLFA